MDRYSGQSGIIPAENNKEKMAEKLFVIGELLLCPVATILQAKSHLLTH